MKLKETIIAIFALVLLCGCQEQLELDRLPGADEVYLEISAEPAREVSVGTRSQNIAKIAEEKKLNNLYVFFFDNAGVLLEPVDPASFGSYVYKDYYNVPDNTSALVIIPKNSFKDLEKSRHAQVYVVANLEKGSFDPKAIHTLDDLKNYPYRPKSEAKRPLWQLPADGMPMFGQCITPSGKTEIDLTIQNTPPPTGQQAEAQATATLKALMCRVDIDLGLFSEATDETKRLPSLEVFKYGMVNRPLGAFVGERPLTGSDGTKNPPTDLATLGKTEYYFNYHAYLENKDRTVNSIYFFENHQDARPYTYPAGIRQNQRQRFKPFLAGPDATHFVIYGRWTTYNHIEYNVKFTFFLGSNPIDDFNNVRNCHYKNNITLHNIVVNDKTGTIDISYDARVDVDDLENRYFIKMLREREHDAHFCVTPMDIYLNKPELHPNIRLEVDGTACKWLRMEKVSAADMQNGTLTSVAAGTHLSAGPWTEGHGKRKFFTTDLLTDPAQLGNSVACTIDSNRDRVYLYLDENISVKDRQVALKMTYTDDEVQVPIVQEIVIGQHGLLEVQQMSDANNAYEGNTPALVDKWFYVETEEEYLNFYDPLGKYESSLIYKGLEYGLNGAYLTPGKHKRDNNYVDNYNGGLKLTKDIYAKSGKPVIISDKIPVNAGVYCYGKNKTDSQGKVNTNQSGWCLPAIRQLERIITQYYNRFPDFQGNFYWSANPGDTYKRDGRWPWDPYDYFEEPDHARATKYAGIGKPFTGKFGYLESGHTSPYKKEGVDCGGWAPRTEKLRVRAIYVYEDGKRLPQ